MTSGEPNTEVPWSEHPGIALVVHEALARQMCKLPDLAPYTVLGSLRGYIGSVWHRQLEEKLAEFNANVALQFATARSKVVAAVRAAEDAVYIEAKGVGRRESTRMLAASLGESAAPTASPPEPPKYAVGDKVKINMPRKRDIHQCLGEVVTVTSAIPAKKRAAVRVLLSDGRSRDFRLDNVQKQLAASSATDASEDKPTAEGVGEAVAVDTEGVGEAAAVPTEGPALSSANLAVELDDMLDEHWLSKRDGKKERFGDEGIGAEGEHGGESEPKDDDEIADGETAVAAIVAQPGAFAPGAYATSPGLSKAVQIRQCGPGSVVATVLSLELERVNLPVAALTAVDKAHAAKLVKESVVVGGKTINISSQVQKISGHLQSYGIRAYYNRKGQKPVGHIGLNKLSISEGLYVVKKIIGDMKGNHCAVTARSWYARRRVHQIEVLRARLGATMRT